MLVARSAESDTHPLFWGTASHGPPPSNNHNHHEDTITTDDYDYNENNDADDGGENDNDGSATTLTTMNEWDGSMLLSSDLAALDGPCGGAAVAFPLGAFYYCDDSMAGTSTHTTFAPYLSRRRHRRRLNSYILYLSLNLYILSRSWPVKTRVFASVYP